jgi:hypothetical protein
MKNNKHRKTTRKSTSTRSKSTRAQRKAVERHRLDPKLFIVATVKDNPRRKGSHGAKSMDVILRSRKPMAVETFVEKGGRLRDLHWDINAGHVKTVKKAG